MKQTDLAWAAGIIDGEGSIHIQKTNYVNKIYPNAKRKVRRERSPSYTLRLTVRMTDKPTIEKIAKIFEGRCLELKRRTVKNKKVYSWAACGYRTLEILNLIEPYSVTKKNQIKTAYKFMKIPRFQGGRGKGSTLPKSITDKREQYYQKMKTHNHGGN
ncbi:hypothetical protein LCGC14_1809020 [marine sediment metagenome]|uniref:Homing endonuclease LAGLIDADG domain-containing protein n=1 Tax=marine sediment metagenome TaxID=412755 RepID=A0A0F9GM61_9ZZZZ